VPQAAAAFRGTPWGRFQREHPDHPCRRWQSGTDPGSTADDWSGGIRGTRSSPHARGTRRTIPVPYPAGTEYSEWFCDPIHQYDEYSFHL